ncbi:MAG TPA: LuxR C-terminal-related transcriptional regulator [Baekduia sp.]|uniref:helix-turn-helix transcriptional regulator n=1 Tax=Baekduia sp. TaxID=2600305 RepID=UPI002D77B3BB|nr:LuxR C-terminal-related transcriptional regulator [Baekduia sp.]HET6509167.1 LuxR C-terminal-related transcriptional regulator [Baekduia sp.]
MTLARLAHHLPAPPGPSATPAREGLVARGRLVGRLERARDVPVVLLAAPAGYGKTVLLRQWEAEDARPFTWLRAGTRLATEVTRAVRRDDGAPERVLVADHRPPAAAGVEDLAAIAARLPPGCLLAVATRDAAGLAHGRLRAQRRLLTLDASELAMTRGETRAALDAAGVRLPAETADALVAAIDGWPAAVSLAAQALDAASSPGLAARAFGGEDDGVADLVRREILDELPARRRRLLRRAAVLDALDPDGCAAVLRAPEARTLAADLAAVPLKRGNGGVRCHPLVRDVLLAELRAAEPGAERELHRRAGAWHAEHDDVDGAVRHALAAGDLRQAGTLLWDAAQGDAWSARATRLRRRLERIPAHAEAEAPTLALAHAIVAFTDLDAERLDHHLGRVTGPLSPSAAAGRATLGALVVDDSSALRAQGARASTAVPRCQALHGLGRLAEGSGALLAGAAAPGAVALDDGRRACAVAAPGLAALCEAELALLTLLGDGRPEAGDRAAAREIAERARARVVAEGLQELPATALTFAVAGLVRALDGRYAAAAEDVASAERLLDGARPPAWYAAQTDLAAGRARLRFGAIAGARERLARADRAAGHVAGADGLRAWIATALHDAHAVAVAAPVISEPLTVAELRVLRLLPTHLSYREIGERFRTSGHTVKSQAHAVYRKLGVTSRSEAVARATAFGLVDAGPT